MGWIEDRGGRVLMVCQKSGQRLWTLPGGKIERMETVESGLRREVLEEVAGVAEIVSLVAMFDRSEKANVTFLYRAMLPPDAELKPAPREISSIEWRNSLPDNCTPSLGYFWRMMRG